MSGFKDETVEIIRVNWDGPYSWPKYENANNLPSLPKLPGVYLQTFEYKNGFLIYAAGITRRQVKSRFGEHTRKYKNGEYNVLDIDAIQLGNRKEVWHGWDYAKKHRSEFEQRKTQILEAVEQQLSKFRIFVSKGLAIDRDLRFLERTEAAVMLTLYKQLPPVCDLPDKGMQLMPRWESERPLILKSSSNHHLHGLPDYLEI
ncbi:MAG: hypothetical protein KDE48_25605 [Anaerolineales bacterium]|nr:hypothetical protein [Anaerolineales bacterium]